MTASLYQRGSSSRSIVLLFSIPLCAGSAFLLSRIRRYSVRNEFCCLSGLSRIVSTIFCGFWELAAIGRRHAGLLRPYFIYIRPAFGIWTILDNGVAGTLLLLRLVKV